MNRLSFWLGRLSRAHTRIAARILLFNLLLVFLPVAGLLYLDAYEENLLEQQERAMVDAGRVLAAALGHTPITGPDVEPIMRTLGQRTDQRFRVVSADRFVIADSHATSTSRAGEPGTPAARPSETRSSWLYRLGAAIAKTARRVTGTEPVISTSDAIESSSQVRAAEVEAALAGRYGSATRLSPGGQRSVTLYSALPIVQDGQVAGAVLVSQSTWRLLQRVYTVRLHMFTVVVVSVGLAVVLMAVVSMTIVTPVRRLRDDAASLADRRGRLLRRFRGTDRKDEIGELARALDDLTGRLDAQLRFTEAFSADVSHEFRNPLASIRATAELLADTTDPGERAAFAKRIERDIRRLEQLLQGVRDITLVDTQLEEDPRTAVDVVKLVSEATAERGRPYEVHAPRGPIVVGASADRLHQVLGNLLDNAESFSPPGTPITISIDATTERVTVAVHDRGPGIATEHVARAFDRFFSHRPGQSGARARHTGLGLSIGKAIVDSYDGTIDIRTHADGGAVASFSLPRR